MLSDGRTPDQGSAGRRWRRHQVESGENVQFKTPDDQAQVRGGDLRTNRGAAFFLTLDGVMRGKREIRQLEAAMGQRFSADAQRKTQELELRRLLQCQYYHKKYERGTSRDRKKYGWTDGCPACTQLSLGARYAVNARNDECRGRIASGFPQGAERECQDWERTSTWRMQRRHPHLHQQRLQR